MNARASHRLFASTWWLLALTAACYPLFPGQDEPPYYDPNVCYTKRPPTSLEARAISTRWVMLTWPATGWACDYPVERDIGTGIWESRGTSHGPTLIDEVPMTGHVYRYRVGAPTGIGYSPTASVKTFSREHWLPISGAPSASLGCVQFVNDHLGYACGEQGTILRTEDAGATWGALVSAEAPTGTLTAIAFVDESLGIVVGEGGLWVTRDAGASWTHALDTPWLQACAFASPTTAMAAGDNMQVWRSTDAGDTWTQAQLGTGSTLLAVAFADADHGWIAGRGLFETTDGGVSWVPVDLQGSAVEWFQDLACSGEGALLAVHRDGVLRIAGGTLTWSNLELADTGDLAVTWADAHAAFAGSVNGLYRSLDAGQTWQAVSWPLFHPRKIAFADPSNGVAVGYPHDASNGPFLRTTDGGGE
jgi:photosystem II stability/assembly factor-like uncharacterized protein